MSISGDGIPRSQGHLPNYGKWCLFLVCCCLGLMITVQSLMAIGTYGDQILLFIRTKMAAQIVGDELANFAWSHSTDNANRPFSSPVGIVAYTARGLTASAAASAAV
jgi:hypothetical protein